MTALEKYIDDLVNDKEPQDDFPKNESSWEELYDLCGRLIAEIVTLRRNAAQQSVNLTLRHVPAWRNKPIKASRRLRKPLVASFGDLVMGKLASERAYDLAVIAHSGQFDKAGKPYIEHVQRVAGNMQDEITKTVAYLHDVVEDTSITVDEISAKFGNDVANAVSALSRMSGESYADFINRLSKNSISRTVKVADLKDNLDLSRLQTVSKVDKERAEKYKIALMFIEFVENQSLVK